MKCPNCEKELAEGKLYCEYCGYEIQIVPDFEPEIENSIIETLSGIAEDFQDETEEDSDKVFEESLERPNYMFGFLQWLKKIRRKQKDKKHLIHIIILSVAFLFAIISVIVSVKAYQYNSYNYQVKKAVSLGKKEKYVEAAVYLERAVTIDAEDPDASLLLADYYCKQNREDDAILTLESAILTENGNEDIYRKLITIYEERQDFDRISKILSQCKEKEILTTFQAYAALPPEFSVEEGEYEEVIPLKLIGNTSGDIYYTLDGSKPDENSLLYTSPIFLETGSYKVSAIFVNQYGVKSEIIKRTYNIAVTKPNPPEISLYSGVYQLPEMIEVEVPDNCKVYYTIDGKEPTQDTNPYMEAIPMPFGATNFRFAAFNMDGVASETVERAYQLEIPSTVKIPDAVNATVEILVEKGIILDKEGHMQEMPGNNMYICSSGISFGNQPYYLIMEFYQDATGVIFKTENNYAVNALTGEVCITVKEKSGYYQVLPF